MGAIGKFFKELRRRRVLSNAALYIVAAWVTIQVASEAIDAGILRIPLRDVFVAAFLGFPIALIVSWFYDITRRGLVRTPPVDADPSFNTSLRKRDYGVLSALAAAWLAAVFLVVFWGEPIVYLIFAGLGIALIVQGLIAFEIVSFMSPGWERRMAERKLGRKL